MVTMSRVALATVVMRPLAYRPKDAAAALGISKTTLYDMIAKGKLESRKLEGATVILYEELRRVLDGTQLSEATKAAHAARD